MSYNLLTRVRCYDISERVEVLLAESIWPYVKAPGSPLRGWRIGIPGAGKLWLTMTDGGMIGAKVTLHDYAFFKVDPTNYDPAIRRAIKHLKCRMCHNGIRWVNA